MVKMSEYIKSLPGLSDIPKVGQQDLRRLYRSFVLEGKPDMETLDEVESRLIARAGIWIDLNNTYDLAGNASRWQEEQFHLPPTKLVDGRSIKSDEADVDEDEVLTIMNLLGMPPTDAWRESMAPYTELVRARKSHDITRRMLAVDRMINVMHLGGQPLADVFIEGDAVAFLERLSSSSASLANLYLYRRPTRRPVHVRRHRRRRR